MKDAGYEAQALLRNADPSFFGIERFDLALLWIGVGVLAAALLPRLLHNRNITAPLVFMLAGVVAYSVPGDWPLPDLVDSAWWPMRLSELGVIVALTAAGLKLDRPFAWASWRISWRLLAITMPLTIFATAVLGWWAVGLLPAAAILLGAVLAPTDPVLASDVQTTAPDQPDNSGTTIALTTEAGMNDGLAFPFTMLALAVTLEGLDPAGWFAGWLTLDVGYKIVVGIAIGAAAGWCLAKLLFEIPATYHLARTMTGVVAISLTLLPYAVAELASSYGFIAVFVAACVFRYLEAAAQYQRVLHDFSVEMERMLVAVLMFLIGAYVAAGVLSVLTPVMVGVALSIVLVVRPLTGMLALIGCGMPYSRQWVVAFFGIRGIGSIFYLAYAIHHAEFPQERELWAMVFLIVILSAIVHGISAKPVLAMLDRRGAQGGGRP